MKKNTKTNLLNNNLAKRSEEISAELTSLHLDEDKIQLNNHKDELNLSTKQIQQLEQRQSEIDVDLVDMNDKITQKRKFIDTKKKEELEKMKTLQDEAANLERWLNKRSVSLQKVENFEKKIRELGSIPQMVSELTSKTLTQLNKMLKQTQKKLKNFETVNKKAGDQYVQFTTKKENLENRKSELEEGNESIENLIEVLDERKDTAIARTFKGVAKQFSEVFHELTGGVGNLVMTRKSKEEMDAEDEADSEDPAKINIQRYNGVAIKVDFANTGDFQLIQSLSGGQKGIVALSLIFAIQRCDPAPFYLFDEIDAALDDTYRKAVGKMLSHQSSENNIQFVVSTFRPELLSVAKKFYAVELSSAKESTIQQIPKTDAQQIIEEKQVEDHADDA